jgi:hypothetical protein
MEGGRGWGHEGEGKEGMRGARPSTAGHREEDQQEGEGRVYRRPRKEEGRKGGRERGREVGGEGGRGTLCRPSEAISATSHSVGQEEAIVLTASLKPMREGGREGGRLTLFKGTPCRGGREGGSDGGREQGQENYRLAGFQESSLKTSLRETTAHF